MARPWKVAGLKSSWTLAVNIADKLINAATTIISLRADRILERWYDKREIRGSTYSASTQRARRGDIITRRNFLYNRGPVVAAANMSATSSRPLEFHRTPRPPFNVIQNPNSSNVKPSPIP